MSARAFLLLTLLLAPALRAQEEADGPAPGHSIHGEAFNVGPRQAAHLIGNTGDIAFPATTKNKEAQAFLVQGVGQLHGFWDFEAERAFRQAAALDPDLAIAYWGMACANFSNEKRAKEFIAEADKRKEKASDRERAWIGAFHKYFTTEGDKKKRLRELVRSLEQIVRDFPDDLEAKAFLLRQIYHNHSRGGLPVSSHLAVNFLAEDILRQNELHPANHYRIHLWDREKAAEALTSAANCGPSAPAIAHMWHMPGHIYTKLHRYQDAAYQQEASARTDHAHMIKYQILPDRIHNFAHNNEWLTRNLVYVGRASEATELARNMVTLPRVGKFEKENWKYRGSSWAYGRQRFRDVCLQFEQWEELLSAIEDGFLIPGPDALNTQEIKRLKAICLAELGRGDEAQPIIKTFRDDLAKAQAEQLKAKTDAGNKARKEKKNDKQIADIEKKASGNFTKRIDGIKQALFESEAHLAVNADPIDEEAARKAVAAINAGKIGKTRLGMLHLRAGDAKKALEILEAEAKANPGRLLPAAARLEALHALGKKDEAAKALKEVRALGGHGDRTNRIYTRISRISVSQGGPVDWRAPSTPAKDLGHRPTLESFGPFRWSPPEAPGYALFDQETEVHTSADLSGKPRILIFYLGGRCSHCLQQLNAFEKSAQQFKDAGLPIVTIGTDNPAGLESVRNEAGDPFPFTMLSDDSLTAFRNFRAFDDFENVALHGTFLVDGQGRIRWQDIGHEPFMKPEWLLEECERLLGYEL